GPRGCDLARAGRPAQARPPVRTPRRVDPGVLARVAEAAERRAGAGPLRPFLDEPQDGSSGVLATLDAIRLLADRSISFGSPVVCAGPDMVFAPMKPRSFESWWSSHAWVQVLRAAGLWDWTVRPDGGGGLPLRLWPSRFEHLPDVWSELARGSAVLLSPAAAEGLAPGEELPVEVLLGGEPTPDRLADRLSDLLLLGPERVDSARRELCRRAAAHRGRRLLQETAAALGELLRAPSAPDVGGAAVLLLDRTRTLGEIPSPPGPLSHPSPPRLSVVLTCYDLGPSIGEAVASVWASERIPDEVLLVDDGSRDEATLARLAELETEASSRGLPLTVLRQRNRGLAGARNAGLDAARGDFISFLDGDDLIEPSFYRLALDLITRNPRLGGVASWSLCFGPEGPVGFWNPPHPELPMLFVENLVCVPCLTRTALLRDLGGYDARQRYNYEDWELSVRILAAGWPIVTIPAFLARYRVRPDSLLRTLTPAQNQVMRERLLETHRETAARFGLEIALQIEHRLKTLEATAPGAGPAQPLWQRTARKVLDLATPRGRRKVR
ncbi:MAG TPA: glycosyltransferase family A protein, partial [Thermoanaerobaculia bacterium]|nr:glycosyltransferase family A protein [Thermoanaerobaculia bacterium]